MALPKKTVFILHKDYSPKGVIELEKQLKVWLKNPLPKLESSVKERHDVLLFIIAYPANAAILDLAQQLMNKLVQAVKKEQKRKVNFLYNSGITGSLVCAQFGLWLNQYLCQQNLDKLYVESFEPDEADLVNTLGYTLDNLEQETLNGQLVYFKDWNRKFVGIKKNKEAMLRYLVSASMQLAGSVAYRENKFSHLQLYTSFLLQESLLGISLGRAPFASIMLHPDGLEKKYSLKEGLELGSPRGYKLTLENKAFLVRLARGTMASLLRETDTYTYAQEKETELYDMGDGLQIALYYMIPEQKFSWQSYVGFLVFKNSVPIAYGGCWLLHKQSAFGVNVLPPFRGGESSKIIAQLLRLYHYRFGVDSFTVDPYQIGKGNEEAIESGAFWFYYKLGFRPSSASLRSLAEKEFAKISKDKLYRSSRSVLLKLVNADIVWNIGTVDQKLLSIETVSDTITKHVCKNYNANRFLAQQAALAKLESVLQKKIAKSSFVNRMALSFDAIGVFEKLSVSEVQKLAEAYHLKSDSEALAFNELQKLPSFWGLL